MDRRTVLRAGGALAAGAATPAVFGQAKWPSREITLINPNAPGASTDLTARIIAQALEKLDALLNDSKQRQHELDKLRAQSARGAHLSQRRVDGVVGRKRYKCGFSS